MKRRTLCYIVVLLAPYDLIYSITASLSHMTFGLLGLEYKCPEESHV
jgi:hypothetical protein